MQRHGSEAVAAGSCTLHLIFCVSKKGKRDADGKVRLDLTHSRANAYLKPSSHLSSSRKLPNKLEERVVEGGKEPDKQVRQLRS